MLEDILYSNNRCQLCYSGEIGRRLFWSESQSTFARLAINPIKLLFASLNSTAPISKVPDV